MSKRTFYILYIALYINIRVHFKYFFLNKRRKTKNSYGERMFGLLIINLIF